MQVVVKTCGVVAISIFYYLFSVIKVCEQMVKASV